MTIIRKDGFDYEFDPEACKACAGRCCRGESGDIWVNQKDIAEISRFLNISPVLFIEKYLHKRGNRFTINERFAGQEFDCVFLNDGDDKVCTIYPVRPEQCRKFPFWSYYRNRKEELFKECPGIRSLNRNVT
ncbi:MAG: YkgJ family cysteine cluster protein [Proteobacteria bacterium]|nr:YkgJ family cysteine cluster protein [Pseudomonadota bacterium]